MIIAACRLDLFLPNSRSLKAKRQCLSGLKTRIRNRFNVSVAEVDHNELWQRAALGIAVVSNDVQYANRVLSKVVDLVNGVGDVVLLDYAIEMR
jgi:hypothetical protein